MTLRSRYFQACLSRKAARTGFGVAFLLALSTMAAIAAPIVVDANATPCVATTAHYTTIQAAVNAAPAAAVIQVCPGVYPEQVSIGKSLTLKGVLKNNQAGAVIAIPASGGVQNGGTSTFPIVAQVDITAPNVTLNSLTIDGTGGIPNSNCSVPILVGVAFEAGSSGRVTRSAVRNQAVTNGGGSNGYCGNAIQVFSGAAGLITIDSNSIRGFGGDGIAADSPVTVKTNTVDQGLTSANLLQQGTGIFTSAPSTITGNIVNHVAFGIAGGITGSGVTTISTNQIVADGFGVDVYFGSGVTVLNNTITGGLQLPGLTGGNVGVSTSGSTGDTVKGNKITGFYYGVLAGTSQTVTLNTITDAEVGVFGVAGNTVSGNHFYDVTTLLQ